jgi:hypothetical protein
MAQSGVLAESSTVPSTSFIENLFRDPPTDSRFSQVTIQRFVPTTGLIEHTGQVDFVLPALKSPNVYLIQNLMMQVTVKIVDENGKLPTKDDKVIPVNNMLPSLFESLQMSINDVIISPSGTNYAYKDFIQTVLSYGEDAQNSLQCKGFFNDQPFTANEITGNQAYNTKSGYFRTGRMVNGEFQPEGATFVGKVYHDFGTAQKFLPPNTNVSFKFKLSSDKFYLLKVSTDPKNYRFVITDFCLYCPIGILSQRMCNDLYARWSRDNIKYYYDRLVVKTIAVPKGKQDFLSENLFPDNENPSRIFFMFVESDAMLGSYLKSPFAFKRAWTVESSDSLIEQSVYEENCYLKGHMTDMTHTINQLFVMVSDMRKDKEKKKKRRSPSPEESDAESDDDYEILSDEEDSVSVSSSVASKNRRKRQTRAATAKSTKAAKKPKNEKKTKQLPKKKCAEEQTASSSAAQTNLSQMQAGPSCSASSSVAASVTSRSAPHQGGLTLEELTSLTKSISKPGTSEPRAPSIPSDALSCRESLTSQRTDRIADSYKQVWVTKCELELNGSPIDQLYSKGTASDAMQDFVRLQKTLNQYCTQITNGITYEQFLTNSYIVGYDLTTSQQAGLAYNINSIRTGD